MGSAGEEPSMGVGSVVPGMDVASLGMDEHILGRKQRFLFLQPSPLLSLAPYFSQRLSKVVGKPSFLPTKRATVGPRPLSQSDSL